MTAVRSFRGLGCPQQAFGIFARCAAQNTMLVIFVALWRIFFPPELISLLRLSMLRQRIRGANATSLTAASVGGISLTLQRDALNHHRCQYSKLVRRSYRAGSAAIWWKSFSIVITKIITASLSIVCEIFYWIFYSLFVHNGEYLDGT